MCYYNSFNLPASEIIILKRLEKQLRALDSIKPRAVQSGFIYRDWPVITMNDLGNDPRLQLAHWEYIPGFINNEVELMASRQLRTWLNAKSENLFKNEKGRPSMYAEGAQYGRCLVLSSGFFEWRHLHVIGKKGQPLKQTEKIPYHITLKGKPEYFFMAGVSRVWTNHNRNQSALTFAIVTTEANSLMKQIHNSKLRQPTILTEDLAAEWLRKDLTAQQVSEIASFQMPAEQMEAWTVAKKFIDEVNPSTAVVYDHVPGLVA